MAHPSQQEAAAPIDEDQDSVSLSDDESIIVGQYWFTDLFEEREGSDEDDGDEVDESTGQSHLSSALENAFDASAGDDGSLRIPFNIEMRYTSVAGNNRLHSVRLISPSICIDFDLPQSQQMSQDEVDLEHIMRTRLAEGRRFNPTTSDLMILLEHSYMYTPPTGEDRVVRPADATLSFPGSLAEEIEQGGNDVDGDHGEIDGGDGDVE